MGGGGGTGTGRGAGAAAGGGDGRGGLERRLADIRTDLAFRTPPPDPAAVRAILAEAEEALAECRRAIGGAVERLQPFIGESGGYQLCKVCEAEQYSGLPIVHRGGCPMIGLTAALAHLEGGSR